MGRPKAGATEDLKQQFGMWLGLPDYGRKDDERTQEQWADKFGVAPKTLTLWKSDPIVQESRVNSIKVLGGNEKLAVVNALIAKAKTGDYNACRVYLEWQGEIGAAAALAAKQKPQALNKMQINLNVKGKSTPVAVQTPEEEEAEIEAINNGST